MEVCDFSKALIGAIFWAVQVSFQMQNVLERNEELKQLETDLGELHTLFKDVATLASMQQEVRTYRNLSPSALNGGCGVNLGHSVPCCV